MCRFICMQLLLVALVNHCDGQRWFNFRLLINPGLTEPAITTSYQQCIDQCAADIKCSAVSYQQASQQCLFSYCAHLHMVDNTGWNTYVLYPTLLEDRDFPAPQLEWMLTDQCGLGSTGRLANIPAMVPSKGTGYNELQSVLQGNALWMNGVQGVRCATPLTSQVNVDYRQNGFTISGWYYLERPSTQIMFFEFGNQSSNGYSIGNAFWIYNGGLYYYLSDTGWTRNGFVTVSYTAPVGKWFFAALVYNPLFPGLVIMINNSQMAFYSTGAKLTGFSPWNVVTVGSRSNYGNFPGRTYCIRLHLSALDATSIWTLATSCRVGRIRFN